MSETSIPIEYVFRIIGFGLAIFVPLIGIVLWFVRYLHGDMKKSIDSIHFDLKPLITKVAIHDERITKLEEAHKEVTGKFNHIDTEIQYIMRSAQFKTKNG